MCGIVGAVAQRDVAQILLEGLKRLEYRGYDSAGIAVLAKDNGIQRTRTVGKVSELDDAMTSNPLLGSTGIAHTRWATHGIPAEHNAHPHVSNNDIYIVHNGIIDNYQDIRGRLLEENYDLSSDTDSELIAHLIHYFLGKSTGLLEAVQKSVAELDGAFALGIISSTEPHRMIAARRGSPLIVGVGIGENFIASDVLALLPVTQKYIRLEENDIADVRLNKIDIYNGKGKHVEREISTTALQSDSTSKGQYKHYMLKEIWDQPAAVNNALEGRIINHKVPAEVFGAKAKAIFHEIERIQIIACGTSYHAGMVARYWIEELAQVPVRVEIASEFRYREKVVEPKTLLVTVSQSGETADTLAALRQAKNLKYHATLAICNVPESSLMRESDLVYMTRAGVEIGVASTKAFTTQLVAFLMLALCFANERDVEHKEINAIINELLCLSKSIETSLAEEDKIKQLAQNFAEKYHALYLGRNTNYPIALEGALKLKEISYIHAEAYPAGELKHGPLALVDKDMPVIILAPKDALFDKLVANIQEVHARGGELFIVTDAQTKDFPKEFHDRIINLPKVECHYLSPVLFTIPLQLLSYYVAVLKGTDVDQPRNLAKSVTVE